MPPEDQGAKGVPHACSSGRSIDVMPDVVLEHILGFLPAEDAVQTSVLAPRWCHLWKSATVLLIECRDRGESGTGPMNEYREFVDRLLLLRRDWPLETCEIRVRIGEFFLTDDEPRLNCVRQAIQQCKVRVLKVYMCPDYSLGLDNLPFVSQHLTRLELHNLVLHNNSVDFSSCPILEHLELNGCGLILEAKKIVSKSLKRLRIIWCYFSDIHILDHPSRIHIHTPILVSLHLDDITKLPPMLHSMPSLVEAFIGSTSDVRVCVTKWMRTALAIFDSLVAAHNADSGGISCVLLNGLSEAKSYERVMNVT